MSRHATSFHVMPRHATQCHVMPCHVMSRHVTSCHVQTRPVTSCHVISCHVMPRHVTSRHVTSCHVMSCFVTSCHVGCPEGCRYHTASAVYNLVFVLKFTRIDFGWGFTPDPTGVTVLIVLPHTLSVGGEEFAPASTS